MNQLKPNQMNTFMTYKDEINAINKEIKQLKNKKKQYFLDNSKHLFTYFEERKKISEGDTNNVNVLNKFFKQNIDKNVVNKDISKHSVIQYLKNVNNEIINSNDFICNSDICNICNIGEMIPQEEDGIFYVIIMNVVILLLILLIVQNHLIKNHPMKYLTHHMCV